MFERAIDSVWAFVGINLAGHVDEPLELLGVVGLRLGLRGMSHSSIRGVVIGYGIPRLRVGFSKARPMRGHAAITNPVAIIPPKNGLAIRNMSVLAMTTITAEISVTRYFSDTFISLRR